ncbi:MAG: RNA methyltransferase [Brachymonas sp.]|nr:RNA methyltransferase [Brachymonas sp.]
MTNLPTPIAVTSRDNPLIKELRRLAQDGAAYRKTGRIWVEGEHVCEAALARGWLPDLIVFLEHFRHLAGIESASNAIKSIVIPEALMKEISSLESAPPLGMVMQLPATTEIQPLARSVVLDRLQDPGNAGSILRSAAAFGFEQIIALKGTVALWSPKVLRSGMGAHFSLRIVELALTEDVQSLHRPLAVTSSHAGDDLHALSAETTSQLNWALGHEGQGVSEALEALAQRKVRIAQPGGQESLNVAAAAAILLYASRA